MYQRCNRLLNPERSLLHRLLAAMAITTVLLSFSNAAGQLAEDDVRTPNPFNLVAQRSELVPHDAKDQKNNGRGDGLKPSEGEPLLDLSRARGAFDTPKTKRSITYATEQASRRTKKSAGPCDLGWTLKGNYCYKLTSQWLTWSKAEEECRSMRSLLAEIASHREQDDLHDFLKSQGSQWAWIGLRRHTSGDSWIWSSGRSLIYSNWLTDEPNNLRGDEDCVQVWPERNSTWNDYACTQNMSGVCQKGYCDKGWTPTRKSCYRLTNEAPRNVARDTCRSMNGFLVEIQNVNEQNELRDYLTPLGNNYADYRYPWIGLSDPLNNRSWRWDSGSSLMHSSWIAGEPNNDGGSEYCVTVRPIYNFSWNDAPCTLNSPGVCKQHKGCGGSIVGSGTIRSPNFPERYPDNVQCWWDIQSPSASEVLSLQIQRLSTEECCDLVRIYNLSGLQQTLAGELRSLTFTLGIFASVTFETDGSVSGTGFEIKVTTTPRSSGCDAESSLCRTLSERGFCTQGIHRHYMAIACRRSCGRCP